MNISSNSAEENQAQKYFMSMIQMLFKEIKNNCLNIDTYNTSMQCFMIINI